MFSKIVNRVEKIGFEKFSLSLILIGFLLGLFFIIMFFIGELRHISFSQIKADKFGQFGDIIGGVIGSIWALAGVVLFYAALKKQIEALDNQKTATQAAIDSINIQSNELALQRQELEQTRAVFQEQEKTLKTQQFESTFFNLINLLNSILNSIDFQITNQVERRAGYSTGDGATRSYVEPEYDNIVEVFTGRDCIKRMVNNIDQRIKRLGNEYEQFKTDEEVIQHFKIVYEADIESYLNTIKQILIKIESNPMNRYEEYVNILKAQLTKPEIELIRKFISTDLIDKEFENLLTKYKFL